MPNSIKKSWAVHPFMSHWQGGIYLHEKGQIAPKWSWAHFFSRRGSLWQKVCAWQRIYRCKAVWKTFFLPAACTKTYPQLLRCWLRWQETKFCLDCLLAPCTWQRLQTTLCQRKTSILGLGQVQVSLEESLVFWLNVIPLPHSSLNHGAFPDYPSWSILGSCHCGIEVPLV